VLWFERQVVSTLMDQKLDAATRAAVEAYVDDTLRAMPEHLRIGVALESVVFGAVPFAGHLLGRDDPVAISRRIERWKTSHLDPLRQYVRLLHSLVLFAENELVPSAV
jgi:hypothetical protein